MLVPLLVPLCSDFARVESRRQIPHAEEGDSRRTTRLREGARLRHLVDTFKVSGVEHREKVGCRSDAIKLYKIRKADILRA